ncbi:MAG: hypothetical protein Kow0037_07920 [Calditrichia bacterium]
MESYLIWFVTLLISGIIFSVYFIKFRKEQKKNYYRKKEARSLGIDRPRAQFPFIDTARCIGCGSCVKACPEGDVLGVVFGKAEIINGLRCVGHGFCEKSCPVGAIEVGLGDIKKRSDIPFADEYHESNIPGIFIVGELGGLSLIRNAIRQGEKAVTRIAEKYAHSPSPEILDVVIVGAGPAGLSAALTAKRTNLRYQVIDQQKPGGTILQYPRKKLVMTQPVEIPLYGKLTKSEYEKEELLEIWLQTIKKEQLQIQTNARLLSIYSDKGTFLVETTRGKLPAQTVVLALGRRGTPRKLEVPGETLPKVAYQLVDAQSYRNNKILVVGGGDSAIEAAVGLARQPGNCVYISYRKPRFFRIKKKNEENINSQIKRKKIKPLFETTVGEIKKDSVILNTNEGILEIPNDFVFIFAGGIPPFDLLKGIGIRFGEGD